MDMSSTMSMGMSMTATSGSAMATSTASSSSMSMGGSCKISMLWNWYTVDSCFISRSWHITSNGMFAGSCIGVILLVISLEFLRRLQREYDRYIKAQNVKQATGYGQPNSNSESLSSGNGDSDATKLANTTTRYGAMAISARPSINRITLVQQQLIRATIHMLQFGVAYFVMLLAMYYNGYFIICIIIGAFLGAFIFSWDQLLQQSCEPEAADVTGCCG